MIDGRRGLQWIHFKKYDKFVIETAHKIQEIQQDFNNLSDENKIKFQNDVMRAFMIKGIEGVSEYFSQWK